MKITWIPAPETMCQIETTEFPFTPRSVISRLTTHFPEIKDNQVLVLRLEDGRVITFANRNMLRGVCDDCIDDSIFRDKKIKEYQIITFEEE